MIIDGKYYLVEPYDGSVTGPFDSMQEAMEQGLSVYARCPDGSTPTTSGPVVFPPDDFPDEWTDPWWEYEDMQQRFCNALADCCDEIGDYTSTPPGCDPASTPADPFPSDCTICDYVPGGTWISPNACNNVSCP